MSVHPPRETKTRRGAAPSRDRSRPGTYRKDRMKMGKIKSRKQFNEAIDQAFETARTRDEAKACYDFQREEFKARG